MSDNTLFDWQTEEDDGWDSPPAGKHTIPFSPSKWPRRLAILIIIMAVGGLATYLPLDNRANEAHEAVLDEVRGSHNIVQQAIAQQDIDLLDAYLDHRSGNLHWTRVQRQGAENQQLWTRHVYGFFASTPTPEPDPSVILSEDLTEATVQFERVYDVTRPDGTYATTTLQHTVHYRQDEDGRWLYTKADDEFWGDTHTYTGTHLVLNYPAYDAEMAERLANDLDTALTIPCSDMPCDPITLTLSTQPEYLFQGGDLSYFFASEIELPTITLLGYPIDDMGYNNLFRQYLMATLFQIANQQEDRINWLTTDSLDRMGLLTWPPAIPESTDGAGGLPNVAVSCPAGSGYDLWAYNQTTTEWDFLFSDDAITRIHAYVHPAGGGILLQEKTAEGSRFLLWQNSTTRTLWDISLADNEEIWVTHGSPDGRYVSFVLQDTSNTTSGTWIPPTYYILDLADCDPAGCATQTIGGYPTWSPDSQHVLIENFTEFSSIWLGDPAGQNLVERHLGWGVSWLDNQTYAYQDNSQVFYLATIDNPTPASYLNREDITEALPESVSQNWFIGDIIPQGEDTLFFTIIAFNPTSAIINDGEVHTIQFTRNRAWQPENGESPGELIYLGESDSYSQIPGLVNTLADNWYVSFHHTHQHYALTLNHPTQADQTYTYPHLLPFDSSPPTIFTDLTQSWLLASQVGLLHFINPTQAVNYYIAMPHYTCQFAGWLP